MFSNYKYQLITFRIKFSIKAAEKTYTDFKYYTNPCNSHRKSS